MLSPQFTPRTNCDAARASRASWVDTAESTLEFDAIDEVASMIRTLETVRSKYQRERHKVSRRRSSQRSHLLLNCSRLLLNCS